MNVGRKYCWKEKTATLVDFARIQHILDIFARLNQPTKEILILWKYSVTTMCRKARWEFNFVSYQTKITYQQKGPTMNNARRTQIEKLNNRLSEIMDLINELANEEQEAFDNLPEAFQEGERGEAMEEAIDCLESAASSVEEAMDYLDTAAH